MGKRVGFLGVGWIGRHRMAGMLRTGLVEAVAVCDPSVEMVGEALKLAPGAVVLPSLEAMLGLGLDGVVIATPSALHAGEAIAALEHGVAVFCQKPLGRNAEEAAVVVVAARAAGRLLGVDFSYRFAEGPVRLRELVRSGALGNVFAADLTFHNAYGPDKAWFYDRALSGGGCVMDLGVHLIDLALWMLDFPQVVEVRSHLYAGGVTLRAGEVEDYAVATLTLGTGAVVRLACSWRLHAGADAVIGAELHGTAGGAAWRNDGGSFYDFTAEAFSGTTRRTLASPPDEWGARAAADWAERLAAGAGFEAAAEEAVRVAGVMDGIYAAA